MEYYYSEEEENDEKICNDLDGWLYKIKLDW